MRDSSVSLLYGLVFLSSFLSEFKLFPSVISRSCLQVVAGSTL